MSKLGDALRWRRAVEGVTLGGILIETENVEPLARVLDAAEALREISDITIHYQEDLERMRERNDAYDAAVADAEKALGIAKGGRDA